MKKVNILKNLIWAGGLILSVACSSGVEEIKVLRETRQPVYPAPDAADHLSGEQLAYAYCQQCHQFADPQLLSTEVWTKGVLPKMGHRLGIWQHRSEAIRGLDMMEEYLVNQAEVYPDSPLISRENWEKIVAYYAANANQETSRQSFTEKISPLFEVVANPKQNLFPLLAMVDYDEQEQRLFLGEREGAFSMYGNGSAAIRQHQTNGPAIARLSNIDGSDYILSMGIMDPSNQAKGVLYKQHADSLQEVAVQLRRPVHMLPHDLNEDGEQDIILSEFGNDLGELSVLICKGGRPVDKQTLMKEAGIRKTIAYDWNGDEAEDLLVLITQGDERITLLQKEGPGTYREKTLLRFPPVYGSSYFELADFNRDGLQDILYVNGDNADYSYELKPYHGIRIFLNQGNGELEESYFYPLFGATEASAHDFDQDGDLDIAGIAYFADFEGNPSSGAVYLENRSAEKLAFDAWQLPGAEKGRWLRMEVADTDQDGDLDLLLGSNTIVGTPVPDSLKMYWEAEGQSLLWLENQLK
ncbi:MAG: FG-GAP repeat domain-containing protein [Cyclobacteriaceae bacterium]